MPNPMTNQMERNIAENNIITKIMYLFRLKKKKDKGIKDKIIGDIRTLFESDKEDYYEPVRIGNAFRSNNIKYESNGDKDKTLPIEEYLNEIRPYLSNIINNLKTQGQWKFN